MARWDPHRRKRSGIAGIMAAMLIMAMLFTVTMGYFYFTVRAQQTYNQALKAEEGNSLQQGEENAIVYGVVMAGTLGFVVNNTGPSITIVAFWIYTSGALAQYQNSSNSGGNLPMFVGQGKSVYYSQTNVLDNNPFQQYIIKILTSRGNTFEGTYPSSQSLSSINSEVAAGLGSLQMHFSTFTWYDYSSGPQQTDNEGDYYQYCAGGVLCQGGNYALDVANPHSGSLIPEGNVTTDLPCEYGFGSGVCGTRVPIAFSVAITNEDPTQADLVINSEANLWIMQTCDSGISNVSCVGATSPVYVFYVMNVNQTTGAITSTSQGSFSQITIPYGSTVTIFFGAASDLSLQNYQEMSITTDDQVQSGVNQGFVGQFAVFLLFSGTKIPPSQVQIYGQNIPFQSLTVADNVASYFEAPLTCTSGASTVFALSVQNSVFSPSNITQVSINASAFSSVSATSPAGWTLSPITKNQITWTNKTTYWITPGQSLIFSWTGTAPSTSTSEDVVFPITIHWYNGALSSMQVAGACIDSNSTFSNIPSGAVAYVPIYLFNYQNVASSSGTQVMLNMNWAKYSAYLDNPVDNVLFFDGNGHVLNAWMENGTSNSATNSIVWVNMGSDTIAADSATTIYMAVYPKGTSELGTSGPFGEAPQLSSTFGKYDDGAIVFSVYANFQGSSMPSGWTKQGSASFIGGQLSSGGVELVSGLSNKEGAAVYGTSLATSNIIIEASGMYQQSSGAADNFGTGFYSAGPGTGTGAWNPRSSAGYYAGYEYYSSREPALYQGGTRLATASSQTMPNSGTNYIFTQTYATPNSVQMSYATSTSQMYLGGVYSGLTNSVSYSGAISNSQGTLYLGASTGGSVSNVYLYWIRARIAPPNGVMPTVVLGALTP